MLPIAILAGGLATRLKPLTEDRPKALVDVAGRPFIEHQLDLLKQHNFQEVVLCVGHLGAQIEALVGDGRRYGLHVAYAYDGPVALGTGGALRKALPQLGETFMVMYGDSYLDCDYEGVASHFLRSQKDGLMTVYHNKSRWERSNVLVADGHIVTYNKTESDSSFEHVDYGLGAFRRNVFLKHPLEVSFDLAQVYRDLLAVGQLAAYEVHERFHEIGSFAGLKELASKLDRSSP